MHGSVAWKHVRANFQDARPPKIALEDVWGRGSQPWHSLTHTISIHIEDSPGALNYIWALSCRGLHCTSLLPSCFSNVDSGDVYTCRPLVQGDLISSLFQKMLAALEQSRVLDPTENVHVYRWPVVGCYEGDLTDYFQNIYVMQIFKDPCYTEGI